MFLLWKYGGIPRAFVYLLRYLKVLTEWLNEFGFDVRYLSTFDIAFGLTSKDSLSLNHVIILGKYIIYQSRSLNIKPTLTLLKAKYALPIK